MFLYLYRFFTVCMNLESRCSTTGLGHSKVVAAQQLSAYAHIHSVHYAITQSNKTSEFIGLS